MPETKELLLVGGHVAAGKTTYITQQLEREQGTVVIRLDDFWDPLMKAHGLTHDQFRALPETRKTEIESKRWVACMAAVEEELATPGVQRVVLESPFMRPQRGMEAVQVGTEAGAKVTMQILFRPDVQENLERVLQRDILLSEPDAINRGRVRVNEVIEFEKAVTDAFNVYQKQGVTLELYENQFGNGLYPVASSTSGTMEIFDPKAYAHFSSKRFINPDAGFQVIVTGGGKGKTFRVGVENPFSVPEGVTASHAERAIMQNAQKRFAAALPDRPLT